MSGSKVEHEDCSDIMIFMLEFMENDMPRREAKMGTKEMAGGVNEWLESMMG